MEGDENRLNFASGWVSLDLCIGLLGALLKLGIFGEEDLYLPVTSRRYLSRASTALTGRVTTTWKSGKVESPDFFSLLWIEGNISDSMSWSAHVCGLSVEQERKTLEAGSDWRIEIPYFSIFSSHRYLEHARCGRGGHHCLRYHTHFIQASADLKDAVAFLNSASFAVGNCAATASKIENLINTLAIKKTQRGHAIQMNRKENIVTQKAHQLPRSSTGIYLLLRFLKISL